MGEKLNTVKAAAEIEIEPTAYGRVGGIVGAERSHVGVTVLCARAPIADLHLGPAEDNGLMYASEKTCRIRVVRRRLVTRVKAGHVGSIRPNARLQGAEAAATPLLRLPCNAMLGPDASSPYPYCSGFTGPKKP